MEANDVAGRRFEVAAPRCGGRYLLPWAGRQACAVPVPDACLLSTARAAAWVACTVNRHGLPDVRPSGGEDCGLVPLHEELPCVSGPVEDRPVDHASTSRTSERCDHGLASWAREGSAKHLENRIGH